MSKFNRVYEGVLQVIVAERTYVRKQVIQEFTDALELDEKLIVLRKLQEDNPLVKDIIEEGIKEFVGNQVVNQTFPSSWVDYSEKEIIRGQLELIRKDWDKYTLEELASLVK